MKIERINDNQIRCTLNKHDLNERHLKISELAYGSDKAKELFRDMMEQASIDFGFEADDIPLMIEAIPTSKESVILVITKVDDPEEFEEKFSRFGNLSHRFDDDDDNDDDYYDESTDDYEDSEDDYEDDLINCFEQLNDIIESASESNHADGEFVPLHEILKKDKDKKKPSDKATRKEIPSETSRLYSFSSFNRVIEASKAIHSMYNGKNSIWKDEQANQYYLILTKSNPEQFNKACSIISEFGKKETITYATIEFFNEHYKLILKDDAVTKLAQL